MILAAYSKLPIDLYGIDHILPQWLRYLYYTLWAIGIFVAFALFINLLFKYLEYRQEHKREKAIPKEKFDRKKASTELKKLLDKMANSKDYRPGVHEISSILRSYLEFKLKIPVEEMTAHEMKKKLKRNTSLGEFFEDLGCSQFQENTPEEQEFLKLFNNAMDLIKRTR